MALEQEQLKLLDNVHLIHHRYSRRWEMALDFMDGGFEVLSPSEFAQYVEVVTDSRNFNNTPRSDGDDLDPDDQITRNKWSTTVARASSYLFPHSREQDSDFKQRQERASHLPIMSTLLTEFINGVVEQPVTRWGGVDFTKAPAWAKEIAEDVNGQGSDWDDFILECARIAAPTGRCPVYIHLPESIEAPSAMHQMERGRPYARAMVPGQLIDWGVDEFGNYIWAQIREPISDLDTLSEHHNSCTYQVRYCDAEQVLVYRRPADGNRLAMETGLDRGINDSDWNLVPELSFTHSLGVCPLVNFEINKRPGGGTNAAPVPLVPSLVDWDRRILNDFSLLDELNRNQTFALLAVPMSGGQLAGLNVGLMQAIGFDGAGGAPFYISPEASLALGLMTRIMDTIQLVEWAAGGSRGSNGNSRETRSGVAYAYESRRKHSVMGRLAKAAKRFERDFWGLMAGYYSDSKPEIKYADSFDIMSLQEKINSLVALVNASVNKNGMAPLVSKTISDVMRRTGVSEQEIRESARQFIEAPFAEEEPEEQPAPNTSIPTENNEVLE